MEIGRREILGAILASIPAVSGAAPSEQKPMYGMIGKMTAVAGKRPELSALLVAAVEGMPGCLSYIVAHDAADENGIWITEAWDSKDSHDASLTLPQIKRCIAAARPLIAGFSNQVVTAPQGGFGLSPQTRPAEPK